MKIFGLTILLLSEINAVRFTDFGLANEEHSEILAE